MVNYLLKYLLLICFSVDGLSAMCQYANIEIHTSSSDIEEPSICINPKNSNEIVAGSNIDNIYYSANGGLSWTIKKLNSPYGVWGDPCIITDTSGNFYFFHLSNPSGAGWGSPHFLDRIVVQKSGDGGVSWTAGASIGQDSPRVQDKAWAITDPRTNAIYVTWTQFDKYNSFANTDSSHILFSKSIDGGIQWSPAKRISTHHGGCLDDDNTLEGAVPAIGPGGEIYVCWAGKEGIVFKTKCLVKWVINTDNISTLAIHLPM